MRYKKENTILSASGLSDTLGKTAIIEGDVSLDKVSFLADILNDTADVFSPTLILTGLYYDADRLPELTEEGIETLLMESTFAYQDKILALYDAIVELHRKRGWKPKRIINTMEYGLVELFILCEPLGIEVFELKEHYNREIVDEEDYLLSRIYLEGLDYDLAKAKYSYLLEA